jgi:hypothetical protein
MIMTILAWMRLQKFINIRCCSRHTHVGCRGEEEICVSEMSVTGDVVTKKWPLIYELPQMPSCLVTELQHATSILGLSTTTYHSVIRVLYEDMLQYTL